MGFTINVNGRARSAEAAGDTPLLYVLRNDFGLNGAKYGCGVGQCGACTVMIDGKATRSCVTALASMNAKKVMTLESLSDGGKMHPLQQAFIE